MSPFANYPDSLALNVTNVALGIAVAVIFAICLLRAVLPARHHRRSL